MTQHYNQVINFDTTPTNDYSFFGKDDIAFDDPWQGKSLEKDANLFAYQGKEREAQNPFAYPGKSLEKEGVQNPYVYPGKSLEKEVQNPFLFQGKSESFEDSSSFEEGQDNLIRTYPWETSTFKNNLITDKYPRDEFIKDFMLTPDYEDNWPPNRYVDDSLIKHFDTLEAPEITSKSGEFPGVQRSRRLPIFKVIYIQGDTK